ncbi:MAG: hypothetical protein JW801_06205 [Bacteroidales bacterium]|nr:hypothetical protein [Bacteroidales bacterium]
MIKSFLKFIPAALLLLALFACKEKAGTEKPAKKAALSLDHYASLLSAGDMESFHRYNYSPKNGWWRRDISRGFKTEWTYDPEKDQVLVKGGFTELNKDLDLPLGIDDMEQLILRYSDNRDSLRVVNAETMEEIASLSLLGIPVDPISFLQKIDEKKRQKGLYSIQHSPLNNIVEIYFSSDKQFFYVPDTIINQHQPSLPDIHIDSLSAEAVKYIRENDRMIRTNWYFNDD